MIGLGHLSLAFWAIAGAFAAPTADLDAPDFMLGPHNLAPRQDYNQNYRTGGSVNFSPSSNGYSVTFSGAGDFVVGKGWKTGTTRWDSSNDPICPANADSPICLETLPTRARQLARAAQFSYRYTGGRGTRWWNITSRSTRRTARVLPRGPRLGRWRATGPCTTSGSTRKSTSHPSQAPPPLPSTSRTDETSGLGAAQLRPRTISMRGLSWD